MFFNFSSSNFHLQGHILNTSGGCFKSTNEGGEVKGQNERTLNSQLDYSKSDLVKLRTNNGDPN
jgi:hypothetical protein